MSVGTGTALAIAGLGGSIVGDVIKSNQTSNAVNAQTTAAQTASNQLTPYAAGGLDAYNKQRQMLGLPAISPSAAPPGGTPIPTITPVSEVNNPFRPRMNPNPGAPALPGPFGSLSAQSGPVPTSSSFGQ